MFIYTVIEEQQNRKSIIYIHYLHSVQITQNSTINNIANNYNDDVVALFSNIKPIFFEHFVGINTYICVITERILKK